MTTFSPWHQPWPLVPMRRTLLLDIHLDPLYLWDDLYSLTSTLTPCTYEKTFTPWHPPWLLVPMRRPLLLEIPLDRLYLWRPLLLNIPLDCLYLWDDLYSLTSPLTAFTYEDLCSLVSPLTVYTYDDPDDCCIAQDRRDDDDGEGQRPDLVQLLRPP